MVARTILATLDGSAPYQRVQVALVQRRDGRLAIDLCEQHYADGIGWFDQRSLALDSRQLGQLAGVLALNPAAVQALAEPPAVLPFPGPADANTRRQAAGGL